MNESEIICLLAREINRDFLPKPALDFPIGDDCTIINNIKGGLCVSVDNLQEGIHFPSCAPLFFVAYRALMVCSSDLAAMGAQPYGFLLSLELPIKLATQEKLTSLASGLRLASLRVGMPLMGGNVIHSQSFGISLTVFGQGNNLLRRGCAMPGDVIYVSGYLGDGAAGLKYADNKPNTITVFQAGLRAAYFCPASRIDLGICLKGIASSCLDISDGLAKDIRHLLGNDPISTQEIKTCSRPHETCGAIIKLASLPLSYAIKKDNTLKEAQHLALFGGDDYELLFTVPSQNQDKLTSIIERFHITRIGEVIAAPDFVLLGDDNSKLPLDGGGYKHF